ncbi:hypothetical protein M3Y97_00693400 [Aphelenchoides bicaudatus]|nr:hypothetical protein M3Y97_00693400 [Aphelenchoides bicaudatus]
MIASLYCAGLFSVIAFILSVTSSNADARTYRKIGYKYDTLLNPIARLYYKKHKNTALRSIIPIDEEEPAEVAFIRSEPSKHQKFEIGIPNEAFGLNKLHELKDPDLHAFRVDLIQIPATTTEHPTMRQTLTRILHRMRY